MFRTSGSVGALITIGGKAGAVRAKGRHQTTPSIAEGFLGERGLKLGPEGQENPQMMSGAACDIPQSREKGSF